MHKCLGDWLKQNICTRINACNMLEYSSKVKKPQELEIYIGNGLKNPMKNNHEQFSFHTVLWILRSQTALPRASDHYGCYPIGDSWG